LGGAYAKSGDGQIHFMRWGLIPPNANISDLQKINKGNWYVNARSKQIFETYPFGFKNLSSKSGTKV
jgi:putative SOS response-associated peptidase YedK